MATTTDTKVQLTLEVSSELNELLERLARVTGSTKSDVLRKAIALIDIAVEAKAQGQKLYLSDQLPVGHSREIVGF